MLLFLMTNMDCFQKHTLGIFFTVSLSVRMLNEIAPPWHDNEAGSSAWASFNERRCFRGQRGLARPECAVCSRPSPDMAAQDSSSLRHKAPLHILLYPTLCGGPASKEHGSAGCSGTKCISCHWLVPVPVQLLYALRCSARSTQGNIRGAECIVHAQLMTSFSIFSYVIIFNHQDKRNG